jgi:hypothetical protein
MRKSLRLLAAVAFLSFLSGFALAQLPGKIVKRHSFNSVLDPDTTGFTSGTAGFTTNDVAESRIPFKVVKLPFSEPVGDLKTGATGSFTDLVTTPTDESGLMVHFDGTNLLFRLRVSGISSGAKAYSVLIDADMKAGNSGSQADPNYVAPTTSGNGNIGFEWELVLMTGTTTRVVLYEVDGKAGSSIVQQHAVENNNYQISKALSTTHNDADYFFDFYLPIAQFTGLHQIISSNKFRMVATTVSSPTSALQGNRSDVLGVDDNNYALTADAWMAALGGSPGVSLNEAGGSTTTTFGKCTSTPAITGPITLGNNVTIGGTWTAGSGGQGSATINLYRQVAGVWTFVAATPLPVNSNAGWSITGITVASGEAYAARAVASGESECLYSATVYSSCTTPLAPTTTCASTRGLEGGKPANATVEMYRFTSAALAPTQLEAGISGGAGLIYPGGTAGTSWQYWGNNTTGGGGTCGGGNASLSTGDMIMIRSNLSGCRSSMIVGCISGNNGSSTLQTIATNDMVIANPVYSFHTAISGTGTIGAGAQIRLFINSSYIAGYTQGTATTSFQFTGLTIKVGDTLRVFRQTGTSCPTVSNTVIVSCYNEPPIIKATNNRIAAGATTITGTSAANASIRVNKTAGTSAGPWFATADANGNWSAPVPALTATDTYTATTVSSGSCGTTSVASAPVTVASVTMQCASFGASSYGTNSPYTAGGTVDVVSAGSVVRLYLEGALVGSQTLNTTGSGIAWSITSSEPFYNQAKLTVTFQSGSTGTEKLDCSATTSERTVTCGAPASPTINPPSVTISQGQTQTYTISNVQNGLWYSIINSASGITYAGIQATGINDLSLVTRAFNTSGTYNLAVEANDFSGCPVATAAATLTVQTSVLPVRFLNISARKTAGGNLVKWVVASEQQVKHYVVERSTDCSRFEPLTIADYKATNASENHYSVNDATAREQKYCYRIKQVDDNGRFTYSSIVSIQDKEQNAVSVFPNPAHNQAILNFSGSRNEMITLELVDVTGKMMHTQKVHVQQGSNAISLGNLSRFGKGSYVVRVVTGDEVKLLKLLIQ